MAPGSWPSGWVRVYLSFSVPYLATEDLRRDLFPEALPPAVVDLYEGRPCGPGEGFGSVAVAQGEPTDTEVEAVLLDESVSLPVSLPTTAGPTTLLAGTTTVPATRPPPTASSIAPLSVLSERTSRR